MMKYLLTISIFLLLAGCENPLVKKEEAATTSGAAVSGTGHVWSQYNSAKTLRLSEDFTPAEATNIEDMANAWSHSVENKKTFFDFGGTLTETCVETVDLDSYYDSTYGVYKCATWPFELNSSALAVTQIYGVRHNKGAASEYIEIRHADILINYEFVFDTADTGVNYDLRTVILHEMGHFIGLEHKSEYSPRNESVMYPSISANENKRAPKSVDIKDIALKYNINLGHGGNLAMAIERPRVEYVPDPSKPQEDVKILIELRANGECVHKENGVPMERHFVKVK